MKEHRDRRWYKLRAAIFILALMAFLLYSNALAQNVTVKVTVERVVSLTGSADVTTASDYFTHISIDGKAYQSEDISGEDDISPDWVFTNDQVPLAKGSVGVYIDIYDEDGIWSDDDHISIAPTQDGNLHLNVTLNPCSVSGDLAGACGTTLTSEGISGDDRARVYFKIEVPPLPPKLVVPVRICAVDGSPAAASGPANMNTVLLQRLKVLTDNIWAPGARSIFQSAMPAGSSANLPVISDPYPPAQSGPGQLGDILDPDIPDPRGGSNPNGRELREAIAACDAAWTALGVSASPIFINLREFVDAQGNLSPKAGLGGAGLTYPTGGQTALCKNLTGASNNDDAFASVTDNSFHSDPHEKALAHELGHSFFLQHGNGLDDDADGLWDGWCDPKEDSIVTPSTIMSTPVQVSTEVITQLQSDRARGVAMITPGVQMKSSPLIPAQTVAAHGTDPIHDVSDDSVDIVSLGIILDRVAGLTVFSQSLFGMIPLTGNRQYLFFGDLDGDPGTGGSPTDLGFSTSFTGADLVARVTVRPTDNGEFQVVTPTVWGYVNGSFLEIADSQIQAFVSTRVETETGTLMGDRVLIQMPTSLLGMSVKQARMQGIAENLITGVMDRVPDAELDAVTLSLIPLQYPECEVTPTQAYPGEQVTVEASGLLAGQLAKVFLGDQPVAEPTIGSDGNVTTSFTIPISVRTGLRLVSVVVPGTALSAGNLVEILESSNIPPIADAGPDQTVQAGDNCQATVTLNGTGSSDPDGDMLSYIWMGSFGTASGPTSTITLTLGTHTVTLGVNDGRGGAASDTVDVTVEDKTPPNITNLVASPSVLWPPNHKMVPVGLSLTTSDNCDSKPVCKISSVRSNEPENGLGDGDTAPDWEITGDLTANLRAERSACGNGRVYTLTVTCSDAAGNWSNNSSIVKVPHDRSKK